MQLIINIILNKIYNIYVILNDWRLNRKRYMNWKSSKSNKNIPVQEYTRIYTVAIISRAGVALWMIWLNERLTETWRNVYEISSIVWGIPIRHHMNNWIYHNALAAANSHEEFKRIIRLKHEHKCPIE